jgi:hypothetical protein
LPSTIALIVAALTAVAASSAMAWGDVSGSWRGEEASAEVWASDQMSLGEGEPVHSGTGFPVLRDADVEPIQMMAPSLLGSAAGQPRQPVSTGARNPRPALRASAASGLASVPYMIGDTGSGTCIGFTGLLDVGVSHPTLACGRLNIAEANSPLPSDRVYYSYRHFEAATPLNVYQYGEELNVDRHTLAFERTFWSGMCSFELRTPLEYRLSSETTSLLTPAGIDLTSGEARRAELGNISMIFKGLLIEREAFALSGGMGVTLPTAQSVQYDLGLTGNVDYGNGLTADTISAFNTEFANETVYLLPFMAWLYAPQSRWFHQGFLQFEVAANPSTVTAFGGGVYQFSQDGVPFGDYGYSTGPGPVNQPIPVRADLFAQTLMRVNLGWGYNFWESSKRDRYGRCAADRLAGLFEVHYTTTLQDANLSDIQTADLAINTPANLQTIKVGNVNNRVDILNLATGASLLLGDTIITTGFVLPVRDGADRGFDLEYNAQVQRRF